ncbi:regulator of microtubule dynamics protein 2 [Pristis pectinata]|uniref:regulator of microtubule dynamics protein 2 n=1 Tax=Pristis pectinata TaxID=685728 RepID=UPI00223E7E1A|nr:regulator of microtubule dynamics protein 2 [Pristis pectinata]
MSWAEWPVSAQYNYNQSALGTWVIDQKRETLGPRREVADPENESGVTEADDRVARSDRARRGREAAATAVRWPRARSSSRSSSDPFDDMAPVAEAKAMALGLLAGIGVAGLTLAAMAWYRRRREREGGRGGGWAWAPAEAIGRSRRLRQADIADKLDGLIRGLEELKSEVRSLKETVPRLEERVCRELGQAGPARGPRKRSSPGHTASRKRKKSERGSDDDGGDGANVAAAGQGSLSSEEVESERGYITAHTDTEDESEEDKLKHCTVNSVLETSLKGAHEDSQTSELDALLQKADELHGGLMVEKKEGFQLLVEKKDQFWDKVEFLWRLARAYSDMHDTASDVEDKKNYAIIGKELALDAVNLGPQSADSHTWLAIICGHLSGYGSVQTKIKDGFLFKEHIDKAIELRPQDPKLYYLLGRWCYAASQLSWIERKVATALFGEPPNSTIQDALECFLKVEEIHPRYSKANCVYLTKCYKELGQNTNAQMWCDMAVSFPDAIEEQETQEELENLLSVLKQ